MSKTPDEKLVEELRERFNKSGLVLEWQRLTDATKYQRNQYVDVLLGNVATHQRRLIEEIEGELPKPRQKHLRWCQLHYEEACTCGLSERNNLLKTIRTILARLKTIRTILARKKEEL